MILRPRKRKKTTLFITSRNLEEVKVKGRGGKGSEVGEVRQR
jgi:hypothetical protein